MPRYATTDEIAARYRVTVETIRAWARQGKIPSLRFGHRPLLFDVHEVDRCMRARNEDPDRGNASSVKQTNPADGDEPMPPEHVRET